MSPVTLWDAVVGPWPQAPLGDIGCPRPDERTAAGILGATVLVVENEPRLLEAMAEALAEICPRVVTCADAGEGLGAFALLHGSAVLVVDAKSQGLSAGLLAEAFREAAPGGAVVFIAEPGYGASAVRRLGARDAMLRRPFGRVELRAIVHRAAQLASAPARHARENGERVRQHERPSARPGAPGSGSRTAAVQRQSV